MDDFNGALSVNVQTFYVLSGSSVVTQHQFKERFHSAKA